MLINTFMGMFVFGKPSYHIAVVLSLLLPAAADPAPRTTLFPGLVCAFIEEAIDAKLDSLRRGKTRVLESGFDLIIGWNPRILPLVEQLCLANESAGGGCIVVLSEMDKPEMDDFWMGEMDEEKRKGTKIITRQGQAIEVFNLIKVSAKDAASITILAPKPHSADESDAQVTRIMLALTGKLGVPGEPGGISGHVVVELCDVDNMPYVALAIPDDKAYVKDKYVKSMVAHDLTGRLMIQCALQPGLARVFSHILAFSDNEFYFQNFPELSRRRFADVCFLLDDAVPFGIHLATPLILKTKEGGDTGRLVKIMINPPGDQLLDADDEIIVIAEDDDSFRPNENGFNWVDPKDVPDFEEPAPDPTNMLLIGFRRDLDDMINEIDKWVAPGSTLTSFALADEAERMQMLVEGGLSLDFKNMELFNLRGNPVIQRHLNEKLSIENFSSIIVLTESVDEDNNPLTPLNCDSRTLVTVLLIRDIQKEKNSKGALVCEILDPRTEKLLELAKLDDFLSSNDLVSMALGQVAKESDIHGLLDTIFSPEGDEMYIKDIRLYAVNGETLNWWEITARARMRGEVAMGFMRQECGNGIPVLNPGNNSQKKYFSGDKNTRLMWKYPDQLIVFSEGA